MIGNKLYQLSISALYNNVIYINKKNDSKLHNIIIVYMNIFDKQK